MKEIDNLIRAATRQGWKHRRGKHHVLTSPTGEIVVLPDTPSDHRSLRNVIRYLEAAGVDIRK